MFGEKKSDLFAASLKVIRKQRKFKIKRIQFFIKY